MRKPRFDATLCWPNPELRSIRAIQCWPLLTSDCPLFSSQCEASKSIVVWAGYFQTTLCWPNPELCPIEAILSWPTPEFRLLAVRVRRFQLENAPFADRYEARQLLNSYRTADSSPLLQDSCVRNS